MFEIQTKEYVMSEKVELNIKTDSQVALHLFNIYTSHLSTEDKSALYSDQQKLLKTFANFVYSVKFCEGVEDIRK